MTSLELTQAEADMLLAIEKCKVDDQMYDYPGLGGHLTIPLVSRDKRESFILDVSKSTRIALKGKFQNRARQSIILVRYDFGGGLHRNPDGSEIDCPHLHLYREGYGHKWAYPIPTDIFSDITDSWQALAGFLSFCNITDAPRIARGLFI